ncbi:MAG TPA: LA2681 family HEPN domain-containing protein, partial [Methanotrichaceae archaeon]|nr:LA2681 family HEPN domain-containing protein [Methanotrichaceae archaeon]
MTDPEETYKSLLSVEDIGQYEIVEAIEYLRSLIDTSSYLHKTEGLERAIKFSGRAFRWDLTQDQSIMLHYQVATAWRSLKTLRRKDEVRSWESQKDEIENEILHLRAALKRCGSGEAASEMRPRILDDLGNALGYIGRFVEAVECWNDMLELDPSNPPARGNRGIGLAGYSRALYDQGRDAACGAVSPKEALLRAAYSDIKAALLSDLDDEDARGRFQEYKVWLESVLSPEWLRSEATKSGALNSEMLGPEALPESIEANNPSLGSSDEEQSYRKWCLDNRLFLNPLNDLGPVITAAEDSLAPPEMMAGTRGGPGYIECLNELKQEFASARYIYYMGISSGRPHFSDRGVILFNTPDYPAYSLAIEDVKMAFRIFYSIFDKIACLLD